ncbi:T9SS type B sorting domain-containing protein [Mariniflexile litorale]|uniref:T9SS type B sorting domain-containing protein n=1 Tax=Mariniflexile litorale TaxID=3045158 RepID=A0AAU7EJI3_9FLAO|nr:T9SS type B sorting domain-containing protein [Mariniflexile sp. KMM 9835]MDQ8210186.1 T9SS type B sorting domain-containing protein [Mariniflexile sp. KMM 9835]
MENSTFFELVLSKLIILANFAKKMMSFFTRIAKKSSGLKFSVAFSWSHLLQMKKGTYQLMLCVLILFSSATAFSQLAVPFSPRLPGGSVKVKGDIVLIGNSVITGKGLSVPYNGNGNNNSYDGEYINVASGGDASIFSSSTADLLLNNSCKSIVYAGLYWASVYPNEVGTNSSQSFTGTARLNDWNQVKFKLPTGGFIDLVADNNPDLAGEEDDIIFDGYNYTNINNSFKDSPIICYKNVTNLLQGLTEAEGTYTVANIRATRGKRNGGCAGGWTLVIIYESPTLPSKFISVFDGYAGVGGGTSIDIPVSGFQTLPAPSPVVARIGVSALEGDYGITGDSFRFKASTSAAFTIISDALSPTNNFFNSRITNNGAYVNNRNPNSTNTLGFDIKNVIIPNPLNNVLPNDATAGDLKLTTSGDGYGAFVTSFAVDIIEPNILLTKTVEDALGNDIGGANVNLGDELNYVIGFQNIGNDDATKLTIRDILPINIIFNYPDDLDILPTGVTVQSFNAITREIIFEVDDEVVKEKTPILEIRFKVKVVPSCNLLSDACSNSVDNQAYATYEGVFNPNFTISDDPSINSNTGCILTPKATNFLVGVDDCLYTGTEVLCGANVVLTAASGYSSYSWSTSPTGSPVIGTNQSITVSNVGTYYVHNTAAAPCLSINQEITVTRFGGVGTNPVIPYADEVVECPNDGKLLPNIFLCGANASREINTGVSDGSTIIWEKLNEASCAAVFSDECANENETCSWTQVGTGPDYTVNTSGQFRLTLNYAGGCFNRFYFNSYQNLLNPTVTTRDIICTTPGQITVGGVPGGYEYSLDGTTYQSSNIFTVNSPNIYTVYVKQVGVTSNPCIFTVPNIQIRQRNFTVSTIVTPPFCNGGKGTVRLAANDVRPQYSYSIYDGATLINSVGPIMQGNYTFANLNPGTYNTLVETEDGCSYSGTVTVVNPPLLTATSALTKPLTCTDAEITVYPTGGTAPYFYFVNSTTDFQDVPEIVVTTPGTYNITVVDSNNCTTNTSITVGDNPAPVFTISKNDILCYNDNSGEIEFNVTNANGYSLEYSIDNGVTYVSNPVFSNLISGNYQAIIKYSLGASECFTTPENIIITQPDTALTASSGISELAGCGPLGQEDQGKVRITNPQGGTPPYEYSFDNQASWVTTNESFVFPGSYTLYIRDGNGCIYSMPSITLDSEPVAPTIDVSDPDFNCDGTADATVTVTNSGSSSYSYNYLLDGVANTNTADPTVFLNVPNGSHTITVEYKLQSVTTYSNLLYETFGYGDDTTSPGINPTYYCFERQTVATQCKGSPAINDGDYSVTARIVSPFAAWIQPGDHTPATVPATPKGRCLVVNIGASIPKTEILYEKQINDIIPNQPINVEFFAMNLLRTGNTQFDPDLVVALVNASGVEISSFSTGNIPKTQVWENYPKTPMTLDPGSNTSLKFIVRSNVQQTSGNDVAIDDISVYQLPKSCTTTITFPFEVATGKAFTAQITNFSNVTCDGLSNGSITMAAQNFDAATGFQYSINGGTSWVTQLTSPVTVTGLSAATYNVKVRKDATDPSSCDVNFTQTISKPDAIIPSATITQQPTCTTGATITASATGGTPAYRYELRDASTGTVITAYKTGTTFTNLPTGSYQVFVQDANLCVSSVGSSILTVNTPIGPTATLDAGSDLCYDSINQSTLIVNLSGGTAPFSYSLNGQPGQNTNTFSNVGPGTHEIIVTDSNNCTSTISGIVIAPQLLATAAVTKELDCSASPNAVITVTIGGGTADYTYTITKDAGTPTAASAPLTGPTFTHSVSSANSGTYVFTITDATGCTATATATINAIVNPTVTITPTQVSCNGAADGQVILTGSSGSGGYTYSFNSSAFTNTTTYTGLSAGIAYPYEVMDSKGCTSSGTITLTEPTTLVGSATIPPNTSCATSTLITVSATNGSGGYRYAFNGSSTYTSTNTLTVTNTSSVQTITYSVRDINGCIDTKTINIPAFNPPTIGTITNTAITCNPTESTSTVTVPVAAGTGIAPFTYEIVSGPVINTSGGTTGVFNGLTAGTYLFKVTDANGCSTTKSHPVSDKVNIDIVAGSKNNVLCNGENTGFASYTVSGFTGSYSYSINGTPTGTGETSAVINVSNLAQGTYTIVVTDEITGCTDTADQVISQPSTPLQLNLTSNVNANCNNSNAVVTVNVDATNVGTPGAYTFAFVQDGVTPSSTNYTSNNVANLNPSTNVLWDVYVKDINGCTAQLDVTISTDPSPLIDSIVVSNQCTGTTATGFTVNATASGGVGTLEFSIGGAYNTTGEFTGVPAGTYTLSVKDANNCIETQVFTIYAPLTAQAVLTKDLTCAPAPTDATININAANGNGPYSYTVISAPSGFIGTLSGNLFTTSTPGTYQFNVTDANGCSRDTNTVTITPIVNPDITSVSITTPILCNGNLATVQVNYNTTLGVTPFVFSYTNTAGTLTGNNTTGIFNLPADDYTFTITDNKGCTDTQTLSITQPNVITADVKGNPITCGSGGTSLGSVEITSVSGGTGPYDYYITGPSYTNNEIDHDGISAFVFDVINFGIYQVNIIDANGCSVLESDVLVASAPDDLDIDVTSMPVDCSSSSGSAVVSIGTATTIVGNGPFYFAIYDGSVPDYPNALSTGPWLSEDTPLSKSATFNSLIPGVTYTFIVYDADALHGGTGTGCYYFETATQPVNTSSSLDIALTPSNNFTCSGSAFGDVSFNVTSLYPSDTNVTYEIRDALTLALVSTVEPDVVPANGTLPISNFGGLPFGDYIVLVKETSGPNLGCSVSSARFNIAESAVPVEVVANFVKNETCNNLGVVTATGSNGTAPYEFIISASATQPAIGDAWDAASNFNVAAGTYYVHIKDAFNCIETSLSVVVDRDDEPVIAVSTPDACADEGSFEIEVNLPTAGIANYTLQLDSNAAISVSSFPYTFSNLNSGTYTVTITDSNGCIDTENITLVKKLSLNPVVTKELDCTTNPDAEITLNLSDGTSVFSYLVEIDGIGGFNPATVTGDVYTASAAGSYVFRVTDSNSCEFTSLPVVVEPITDPTVVSNPTTPSCPLGTDGTVTFNASGGEPAPVGYTYTVTQTLPSAGLPIVQIGDNYFTGLGEGTYSIEVTDAKNCSVTDTFSIIDPVALAFDAPIVTAYSCSTTNVPQPAKVTVNVTPGTGTAPYKYNFDGGIVYYDTNEFTVIDNGLDQTINYYVQDSKGCTANGSIIVPAFQKITDINFNVDRDPTCLLPTTDVSLTVIGGYTPIAKYEIISPTSAILDNGTNNTFLNLTADTYMFRITDANGCSFEKSFEVIDVLRIDVSGQLISDVICNSDSNGIIEFTVSDFSATGNYSVTVSSVPALLPYTQSQTGDVITLTDLEEGSYRVTVLDNTTNCSAFDTVIVSEPTALTLSITNIDATCNKLAEVTAVVANGTPGYTYAFVQDGVAPVASDYTTSSTALLDPAVDTDWDVYVLDANNCAISTDVTITTAVLPSSITAAVLSQCPDTSGNYEFTIAVGSGIAPYEYNIGSGFQTTPTFTVSNPGTYDVVVKDANGCEVTQVAVATILNPLSLNYTITQLPSCATNDGAINLVASGGSSNYEFSIDSGTYQASASFTAVAAGIHTFTVHDTTTNCTFSIDVNFEFPTAVTGLILNTEAVSCHGGNNGMITATIASSAAGVNDNPIYQYALTGTTVNAVAVTRPNQDSNVFDNLEAGDYVVTVTSGRGCTATEIIRVNEPDLIIVGVPTVVDYACNAGTNTNNFASVATTTVTGGSGTYTIYEFIRDAIRVQYGPTTSYTESDGLGGNYVINVYDDNNCLGSSSAVTIAPYVELDDNLSINRDNAITCNNLEDITVTASDTSGAAIANMSYTVEDVFYDPAGTTSFVGTIYTQTNTTGVFTGLDVSSYYITATNTDTGCSTKEVFFVNEPNTFELTINSVIDVTCFSDSNGSVNVTFIDRVPTPTNEAGSFSYTVVNFPSGTAVTSGTSASAGPMSITNLAAGTYTISATLTSSPYCTVSKNFTITAPTAALTVSETHTEITCVSGNNDGSISASAVGGWPGGYEYQLELTSGTIITPFSSVSNFSGLTAGDYLVSVRDSKNCIDSEVVVLTIPTPISATVTPSTTSLSCFGDTNATITVSGVSGGQGSNFSYTLNMTSPTVTSSGPQASPSFSGLGVGTYNVTITDGYNCQYISPNIVISQPTQVQATLVKETSQTCLTGTTLRLSATGGTGVYEYSDSANFATILGSFTLSTPALITVAPGTHSYYVRDTNSCVANVSNEIKIDPLPVLLPNLSLANAFINCAGDNTGVIIATAQGGLGNYIYTLQDGTGINIPGATQNSPGVFTQLYAGDYQVRVDSGDCTATSGLVSITEPTSALIAPFTPADVTCNGANNGSVEINASGGTGQIKYAISPQLNQFFETNTFDNLSPGNYEVIAQDELGCFELINFTISEPDQVILNIVPGSLEPEVCAGDMDGAFSIDITGGNMPYSVSLDDVNGVYTTGAPAQTQFDFNGLIGGDHIVYIRDNFGCESEWNITFPGSVTINPEVSVEFGCTNNISTNLVTVRVDASNTNPADLDYSLNGGTYQASNEFVSVPAGLGHYIDVRHTNGCIQRTAYFDIEQYDSLALILENGELNEIVTVTAGGSGNYEYSLNGESYGSTNTFYIYKSGDYTVTVNDSYGCIVSATKYMEFIDLCIPNYFTPNNDGVLDTWGPGCASQYKEMRVSVIDRYGRKVTSLSVNQKWDGKYQGKELPSGDYWYVIKLNDKKYERDVVGHFTLYR